MRILRRSTARRGFALVDYIVGTFILSTTLITVTSLNTIKIRSQGMANRRQTANFAAADILDRVREHWDRDPGARDQAFTAAAASGESWATIGTEAILANFAELRRFEKITIDVRHVGGLDVARFIELRLNLRWRDGLESSQLWSTSTLIAREKSP